MCRARSPGRVVTFALIGSLLYCAGRAAAAPAVAFVSRQFIYPEDCDALPDLLATDRHENRLLSPGIRAGSPAAGRRGSRAATHSGRGRRRALLRGPARPPRVSRGTLADAETTIEELYAWQFDSPTLREFVGGLPRDRARDTGAVERLSTD